MKAFKPALYTTALGALVLSAALAAACGGDDDSSAAKTTSASGATTASNAGSKTDSSTKVDASKADALAHQAMLEEKDLPGTGWTVSKTDKFDDGDDPDADTAACKAVAAQQSDIRKKSVAGRAGRAEKEFERDSAKSPIPTSVELEVNVFKDTNTPKDALAAFRTMLRGNDFENCLKDSIGASTNGVEGAKVETTSGTATGTPPQGGESKAYDVKITAQGQTFALHLEVYIWQYSNTGNTLTISGAKEDVTSDLVKATIAKADSKVTALGK